MTGELQRGGHHLEQALESYLEAGRLAPLDLDLRLRRAALYVEMKLWSSAVDDCREVLRSRPADREARRVLEDLLRLHPGDAGALRLLETLK